MRICFVSKEVASGRDADVGSYVVEAGKALREAGHEVWLITGHRGAESAPPVALAGFARVLVNGEGVGDRGQSQFFHAIPHNEESALVHATIQRSGVEFDYIEFPDREAIGIVPILEQSLLGSYAGTVLGVMMHGPTWERLVDEEQTHRMGLQLSEICALEDHAIRSASFRTSPCAGLLASLRHRLGLDEPAGEVLPYPVHLPDDVPTPPPAGGRLEELRFVCSSPLAPSSRVAELIEAFRSMPALELTLLGCDTGYAPYGGSYREFLAQRLPPNVRFREPDTPEEMLRRVREADVCLFPSRARGFPVAGVRAMAAGRIVIGGRGSGLAELISHGKNGFVVDGSDPRDIVRALREDLVAALARLHEIGRTAATAVRDVVSPRAYATRLEALIALGRRRLPDGETQPSATRVSVVIPFYKDVDWVESAVASAAAQTHPDVEIVVVNDGSPQPGAREVLARLAASHPGLRVIEKANGGPASARNRGAEVASGDYLLFLDADNLLRPDYAAICAAILDRRPDLDFVVPYVQFADFATGAERGIYNPVPFGRDRGLLVNRFGDSGAFFRRSLFERDGLRNDEGLIGYEDWALWLDLARLGRKGGIVPRVLYVYRAREGSVTCVAGRPNHIELVGRLIRDHFPAATDEERQLLAVLNQAWGRPALAFEHLASGLPADAGVPDAARLAGLREPPLPPVALRYRVVDAMARRAGRIPLLSPVLRSLLRLAGRLLGERG